MINQFPENKTNFTRLRTAFGKKPSNNAVKFVGVGKVKLQYFRGATSKQFFTLFGQ